MRKLFLFFALLPSFIFAQISDDFEDGDISNWAESTSSRWEASTTSPINGSYSLHHVFDNPSSDEDRISFATSGLYPSLGTIIWRFQIRHEWDPSSSNNWSVFLMADNNATEMVVDGNINAYVVGVNIDESDDFVKVWKIEDGIFSKDSVVVNTNYNWQTEIGNSTPAGFEITRDNNGNWSVKIDNNGGFDNLIEIGTGQNDDLLSDDYFGIFYKYSSAKDRLLWFDDLSITHPIVDADADVADPAAQIAAGTISSLSDSMAEAREVFSFKISDGATADTYNTIVKKIRLKNNNPANSADWSDNIAGGVLKVGTDTVFTDSISIEDDIMDIFIPKDSLIIDNGTESDVTFSIYLNKSNIEDGKKLQCYIDADDHGWETHDGTEFLSSFTSDVISNTFTIEVDATELRINEIPTLIFKDSIVSIAIHVCDLNGNPDIDFVEDVTVSELFGHGHLTTSSSFTKTFSNGMVLWDDLTYDTNVEFAMRFTNATFGIIETDTIRCIDSIFYDDFESGLFSLWQNTSDWLLTNEDSINGNFSLKHNKTGVTDTSFIFHAIDEFDSETGALIWRFNLKNGGFDPTSGNYFAYYLMADDAINAESVSAYAVGVNMDGSDDLLSLWYIQEGEVQETIIQSDFNWNENDFVGIEVIREANGDWQFGFDATGNFDDLEYTQKGNNSELVDFNYSGLKFQYTSSYGGLLWCDDLTIGLLNTPPKIKAVTVPDPNTVHVVFTEKVEELAAENSNNYALTPDSTESISIQAAALLADEKTVELTTNNLVTDNYKLNITAITDLEGLENTEDSIHFEYIIPAVYGDVVITEIMADPSPAVGLPEYEYFEIFNNTAYDIPLIDWKFVVGNDTTTFSDIKLNPNGYIIIISSAGSAEFEAYGDVFAGIGTSDLNNTGKNLKILNTSDEIIYDVSYTDDWYRDEEKDDGGYSLEIINPDNLCSTASNWKASLDESGGTPGSINSVDGDYIDNIAPNIAAYTIFADSIQLVFNEKVDTNTVNVLSNFSLNNGIGNPVHVHIYDDLKTIDLFFPNSLQDETSYTLEIQNIKDECNNFEAQILIEFTYYIAKPFDIVITEIMADPSPTVGLPDYEYVELFNNSDFDISFDNWQLVVGNDTNNFDAAELASNAYLIITSSSGADTLDFYGATYAGIGSSDLTNAGKSLEILNSSGESIYSVTYAESWYQDEVKQDGGWSLEIMNPDNTCSTSSNWRASLAEIGGTPGSINSVDSNYIDTIAPSISSYSFASDSIRLIFSEPVDTISAKILHNYSLNNGVGNPNRIAIQNDFITVDLFFAASLQDEKAYRLSVESIEDECGNFKDSIAIDFTYYIPKKFDVVVTEIMADPTPAVGLPAYEYLELFNITNYDIALDNWQIVVGDKSLTIADYVLSAGSYLIVSSSTGADTLQDYGDTFVGIGSSDLTNAGNTIRILNQANQEIYRVAYSENWYDDGEKEDGGWSLEIINPENTCSTNSNWSASTDAQGGTPGERNSIDSDFFDTFPPELLTYSLLDENSIRLSYNEQLDSVTVYNEANYSVDNGIGNPVNIVLGEDKKNIDLTFAANFVDETNYIITIQNLQDECANSIDVTDIAFVFYLAKPKDIVINEIMADPEPQVGLPAADFLELYNRTNYTIDLSNWQVIIGDDTRIFENVAVDAAGYLIVTTTGTAESFNEYGQTTGLLSSSSLTTTGKQIVLKNQQDITIDSLHYTRFWYHDNEKDDGGWTLEKIDPDNLCSSLNNWTASTDPAGGTPGKINAVDATYIDSLGPVIERVKVKSQFQLEIVVNEFVDVASASNLLKYNVDNAIGNPAYFDHEGIDQSNIKLTFTNIFENGQDYTLYVSGLKDECGNIMNDTSIVFTYYYINEDDIVINEIMFDPSSVVGLPEFEYIELFNRTDKDLEISGWRLQVDDARKNIPDFTLEANQYVILCHEDADSLLADYGQSVGISGFPSLGNSDDFLSLLDTAERIITQVHYFDHWYNNNEKNDGGYAIERIDPDNLCSGKSNWKASEAIAGGTPGNLNAVYAENSDNQAPSISDVFVISGEQVQVVFSEAMDKLVALTAENYTIDDSYIPDSIVFDSIYKNQVDLFFTDLAFNQATHTMKIANLTDECGNVMVSFTSDISFYEPAYNEVVINEIMCDPEPVVSLPAAEYLELYNPSASEISFVNTKIKIGSSERGIPSFNIAANEFLIMTDRENEGLFSDFGRTILIPDMPSIPNSSALIQITDDKGKIYAVVEYTDDWIDDPFKAEGGWSLELIHAENPRGSESNWKVSVAEMGGTPGESNSVAEQNPDLVAPEFYRIAVVNDSSINLIFSETLDTMQLQNSLFTVDHNVGVPIQVDPVEPLYNEVVLVFNQAFEFGNLYEVTIAETITDRAGNTIAGVLSQFFSLPSFADSNSIVINEILFNPRDNGVDYIELYNRSVQTFDLADLYLATRDIEDKSFKSIHKIDEAGYLLFPESYVVLTTKPEIVKEQYYTTSPNAFLAMSDYPSLPNEEGWVCLTDSSGNSIDELHYTEEMHFQLLTSVDGVSLERLNFDREANEKSNWHSAAEQVGFGTPAYQNSQFTALDETSGKIALQTDVFSPDNDGFDDQLLIDYNFSQPGNTVNCYIFNAKGIEVRYLLNNEIMATEGTIAWDGLNNDQNKVPIGIYIIYFEIFNANGNVEHIKKTCVVASKL